MKNAMYYMIIYLSIYFVLSCTASRKSEPVKGKTFVVTDAKTQYGQQLFMQNCQKMSSGWRSRFRACIELESGARFYKKIPGKTWTGCNALF